MSLESRDNPYQAIERLRNLFMWEPPSSVYFPNKAHHNLNESEAIEAQYHSSDPEFSHQTISLRISRNGKTVMGFSMSEEGVEKVWHDALNLSISPPDSSRPGFKFIHAGKTYDELEWRKLSGSLTGIFTDWVEDMVKKGKIIDDPVGFIRMVRNFRI